MIVKDCTIYYNLLGDALTTCSTYIFYIPVPILHLIAVQSGDSYSPAEADLFMQTSETAKEDLGSKVEKRVQSVWSVW